MVDTLYFRKNPIWLARQILVVAMLCLIAPMSVLAQQELPAGWVSRVLEGGAMSYRATGLSDRMPLAIWATDLDVEGVPHDEIFQQAKAQHGLYGLRLPGAKIQCNNPPKFFAKDLVLQGCLVDSPNLEKTVSLIFVLMPQRDNLSRFLRVVLSEEAANDPSAISGMKAVFELETDRWIAKDYAAQPVPLKLLASDRGAPLGEKRLRPDGAGRDRAPVPATAW